MDALDTLPLETLQQMLAEAITARHRLVTQPTTASSNNRSVTYAQRVADADRYINRLKAACAAKTGGVVAGPIYLTGGR